VCYVGVCVCVCVCVCEGKKGNTEVTENMYKYTSFESCFYTISITISISTSPVQCQLISTR